MWVDICRIRAQEEELEASPSLDSSLQSSDEPSVARPSHMASDLIGAVHVQGPLSHLPSHMQRQISHSPSPSQSPEGMGVMQIDSTGGVKGGFAGGAGFGVAPYADAEALSKLRGHPAWETQVFKLSFMHYLIKNRVSNHVSCVESCFKKQVSFPRGSGVYHPEQLPVSHPVLADQCTLYCQTSAGLRQSGLTTYGRSPAECCQTA